MLTEALEASRSLHTRIVKGQKHHMNIFDGLCMKQNARHEGLLRVCGFSFYRYDVISNKDFAGNAGNIEFCMCLYT